MAQPGIMRIRNRETREDQAIRIFITGGCGFIGHHLCTRFANSGHDLVLFDNLRRNALQYTDLASRSNVKIIQGDILDPDAITRAMEGAEIVFHLAAMAGVSSYYLQPRKTMHVNIRGTFHVIDAVCEHRPKLFVLYSTSEVYGPVVFRSQEDEYTSQGPASELRWTYAVSKLAAEHLCFANAQESDFPFVIVRPFNIFGPGQVGEGAVSLFIDRALKGASLKVTRDGSQVRAWCYVDDLVDAMEVCVERRDKVRGNIFNIGNPLGTTTILQLVEKIRALTDSSSSIEFIQHRGTDVDLRVPNIGKATSLLGFLPKVGLDEGLSRTIEWHRRANPRIEEV